MMPEPTLISYIVLRVSNKNFGNFWGDLVLKFASVDPKEVSCGLRISYFDLVMRVDRRSALTFCLIYGRSPFLSEGFLLSKDCFVSFLLRFLGTYFKIDE